MKICVLGLDGASPEAILQDDRLTNLRRIMDVGAYGRLTIPAPLSGLAWICMATSRDAGFLRVGESLGSTGHSHEPGSTAPFSFDTPTIWSHLAGQARKSILVGTLPKEAGPLIEQASAGCFFNPGQREPVLTWPEDVSARIATLNGKEPGMPSAIPDAGRRRWEVVRGLASHQPWDYFQFIDVNPGRMCGAALGSDAISDYYLWFDQQIGSILELLEGETILLVLAISGTDNLSGVVESTISDPTGFSDESQSGIFVLAAPNSPLSGEFQGARLLDLAPTLLDLAGYEIPDAMQGRSLIAGLRPKSPDGNSPGSEDEKLIRDRLAGLGYV